VALVINALGGAKTGEISNQRQTWITPAGFSFGIWGFLYLYLCAFVLYQLLPKTYTPCRLYGYAGAFELITNAIHYHFICSCIFNSSWILFWNRFPRAWPSLFPMSFLWISLAIMYAQLKQAKQVSIEDESEQLVQQDSLNYQNFISSWAYFLIVTPFTLYFAWITCATIVNVFAVAAVINPADPFATLPLAIGAVIFLASIALLIMFWKKDITFALPCLWALFGILKGNAIQHYPSSQASSFAWVIISTMIVVGLGCVFMMAIKLKKLMGLEQNNRRNE
jgi:hypothetical protein